MTETRIPSIQEQLERFRREEKQWKDIDRPRLLKMMFNPENQEMYKNSSLTQILDKMNEIWNPPETPSGRSIDPIGNPDQVEREQLILSQDPEKALNRPFEAIIKDFRILFALE